MKFHLSSRTAHLLQLRMSQCFHHSSAFLKRLYTRHKMSFAKLTWNTAGHFVDPITFPQNGHLGWGRQNKGVSNFLHLVISDLNKILAIIFLWSHPTYGKCKRSTLVQLNLEFGSRDMLYDRSFSIIHSAMT